MRPRREGRFRERERERERGVAKGGAEQRKSEENVLHDCAFSSLGRVARNSLSARQRMVVVIVSRERVRSQVRLRSAPLASVASSAVLERLVLGLAANPTVQTHDERLEELENVRALLRRGLQELRVAHLLRGLLTLPRFHLAPIVQVALVSNENDGNVLRRF